MYPKKTFTITPIVNAIKGLMPALANSRNRVVSPILKKLKVKVQVRNDVMGTMRDGFTNLL
jgi:hypothetical protein